MKREADVMYYFTCLMQLTQLLLANKAHSNHKRFNVVNSITHTIRLKKNAL